MYKKNNDKLYLKGKKHNSYKKKPNQRFIETHRVHYPCAAHIFDPFSPRAPAFDPSIHAVHYNNMLTPHGNTITVIIIMII